MENLWNETDPLIVAGVLLIALTLTYTLTFRGDHLDVAVDGERGEKRRDLPPITSARPTRQDQARDTNGNGQHNPFEAFV